MSEAIWLPQSALLADAAAMEDIARAIQKIQANVRELL